MNTKSFTMKAAALTFAAVSTVLNAQSAEMTGKVPVDFKASGVAAPAGQYRIAVQSPGIVFVKNDAGKVLAVAMLPAKTNNNPAENQLTLQRRGGAYHLSGYCVVGSGCWSSVQSVRSAEKLEIALAMPRR